MNVNELPDFPWDLLKPIQELAGKHPDGAIDLSIGTPVDPTPVVIQDALRASTDAAPYPTVIGLPQLRHAMVDWCARRRGAVGLDIDGVLATIGSKELIAWLPTFMDLGPGDVVVVPQMAYPTYRVGALIPRAEVVTLAPGQSIADLPEADRVRLIWLNTPGNPHGEVLSSEWMRDVVAWGRAHGALVVSDECYAELDWREGAAGSATVSILDPLVCGDSHDGILMVYSLSKQSNLAGYRAGLVAGDPRIVSNLISSRKQIGMMVPRPVQHAMQAALADDEHVAVQREKYRARRDQLHAAVIRSGFRIEHSEAGLYLWCTRDEDCWESAHWLAQRGIVVSLGAFYGDAARKHVRVALTATDDQVARACARL